MGAGFSLAKPDLLRNGMKQKIAEVLAGSATDAKQRPALAEGGFFEQRCSALRQLRFSL